MALIGIGTSIWSPQLNQYVYPDGTPGAPPPNFGTAPGSYGSPEWLAAEQNYVFAWLPCSGNSDCPASGYAFNPSFPNQSAPSPGQPLINGGVAPPVTIPQAQGMHIVTPEISVTPTNALDVVAPTAVQTPPAQQHQNALTPPTGSNPVPANQIVNTQQVGTNVLTQGPGATVLNQSGGFGQWITDNPALAAGLAIGALFLLGRK